MNTQVQSLALGAHHGPETVTQLLTFPTHSITANQCLAWYKTICSQQYFFTVAAPQKLLVVLAPLMKAEQNTEAGVLHEVVYTYSNVVLLAGNLTRPTVQKVVIQRLLSRNII